MRQANIHRHRHQGKLWKFQHKFNAKSNICLQSSICIVSHDSMQLHIWGVWLYYLGFYVWEGLISNAFNVAQYFALAYLGNLRWFEIQLASQKLSLKGLVNTLIESLSVSKDWYICQACKINSNLWVQCCDYPCLQQHFKLLGKKH